MSKFVGEAAQNVVKAFEAAKANKPCIIFIDEVDSMCQTRGSMQMRGSVDTQVITQLLREMDGIGSDLEGVFILAATNLPWSLDNAILRRF